MVSFTGCSSEEKTITMYDNCPADISAVTAEAVLAAKYGWTGSSSITYVGTPTSDDVQPIITYYGYCQAINEAAGTTLSFNTEQDGSGTTLSISESSTQIITALLAMELNGYTNIYAIYKSK